VESGKGRPEPRRRSGKSQIISPRTVPWEKGKVRRRGKPVLLVERRMEGKRALVARKEKIKPTSS